MSERASRPAVALDWKALARESGAGYYDLQTEDTGQVPVRLFLTPALLEACEDSIYPQIVNATRFPGACLVAITPDVHTGYGVPIGTVLLTRAREGAVAMGPVGYDISCGMMAANSSVDASFATPERRLQFNRAVMARVALGPGKASLTTLKRLDRADFEALIRGGAAFYTGRYAQQFAEGQEALHQPGRTERSRMEVRDQWQPPWAGRGRPERGIPQLGTLGGGNHFIELQRNVFEGTLAVQLHSGSRGFGHGLATNYFDLAKAENPAITALDLGYFTPESPHYADYLDAVAAGANFAMVNRLAMYEQIAAAFLEVFQSPLRLVYEISHNLVQREWSEEFQWVNVHRKGATRAFPAEMRVPDTMPSGEPGWGKGHGEWHVDPQAGHPILIPGSNRDRSFILRAAPGAWRSGYSVNHGAGRRMSRGAARRGLVQAEVDRDYAQAGVVVNEDGRVPIDESGAAYKSAREVVDAVVGAGLARVEHELEPLASIKGAE